MNYRVEWDESSGAGDTSNDGLVVQNEHDLAAALRRAIREARDFGYARLLTSQRDLLAIVTLFGATVTVTEGTSCTDQLMPIAASTCEKLGLELKPIYRPSNRLAPTSSEG